MRILALFLIAIFVSGCSSTVKTEKVIVTETIKIPDRYLDCKRLDKSRVPYPDGLKDKEVAMFIKNTVNQLNKCAANTEAIKSLQADVPPRKS